MNLLLYLTLLLFVSNLKAQESDYGAWLIYVGTGIINEKWSVFTEAQYRNYTIIGKFNTLCFRIAPQYNINKNINLSIGYSHFITRLFSDNVSSNIHEYRPYQQVFIKSNYGRVYLNHRYRLEQRIINEEFRLRFRYFIQSFIPLNNNRLEKNTFYISSNAEIFLNSENSIFDRVRFYVGLAYVISNKIKIEVGSMTQFFEGYNQSQLNVFVFHNFSFVKLE